MAFTRKFLSALGIEADKIDQIIEAHTEVTDGLKADAAKYKAQIGDAESLQKQLDEAGDKLKTANAQLAEANKKLAEVEKADYKGKLDAKEKELEEVKKEYAAKETAAAKKSEFKSEMKKLGYSDTAINLMVRNGFADKIELAEGGASNFKDVLSEIQADSDFSGFTPKTQDKPHTPSTPPANSGGKAAVTKEEILAEKDMAKKLELVAEHLDLFGK